MQPPSSVAPPQAPRRFGAYFAAAAGKRDMEPAVALTPDSAFAMYARRASSIAAARAFALAFMCSAALALSTAWISNLLFDAVCDVFSGRPSGRGEGGEIRI